MIHLTINLIAFVLSAFAFVLSVFVNRRLVRENKELLSSLKRYVEADHSTKAEYSINEWSTTLSVIRTITVDGYIHQTVIKCFTGPDQDYNRLCAEELVEKLNEK